VDHKVLVLHKQEYYYIMEQVGRLVTAFNTNRGSFGAIGVSQTAGIRIMGGIAPGSPTYSTATESWNGSSWTTVNTLNTRKRFWSSYRNIKQQVYGELVILLQEILKLASPHGMGYLGHQHLIQIQDRNAFPGAFGTQTAALIAGGRLNPGASNTNATELWNGTSHGLLIQQV
jgi:hypothetical protein